MRNAEVHFSGCKHDTLASEQFFLGETDIHIWLKHSKWVIKYA